MLTILLHDYAYCSPVRNSQYMRSTLVPVNEQMDKGNKVYKHNGIRYSHGI